jgi:DNA-directed RNA polymerase specialized sigma24 family protein
VDRNDARPHRQGLDLLLGLLHSDRDAAGERYLLLRRRLVKFFGWRGTAAPDELADETMDRVCRRLAEGDRPTVGDPAHYVFGVARNVLREQWGRWRRAGEMPEASHEPLQDPQRAENQAELDRRLERRLACLERCLQALDPSARELILRYYRHEKQAKIDDHGEMARGLGIGMAALRVRLHRIRGRLEPCVRDCLSGRAEGE